MSANVEDIFLAAVEKTGADRSAYLDEVCAGDAALRRQVELLLSAHADAGSFLDRPASGIEMQATILHDGGEHDTEDDPTLAEPLSEESPLLDFLQPSDGPDSLGRLGNYEIREVVGQGGMGIVLKGLDSKLNRIVAIKVLSPELASNAMARKRFLREAQAAAAVSHDHVVTIHAIEEEDRLPHLVMEFISGVSLQQRIDRDGPLETKEILRIGKQAAAGLAAAHAEGLIHRDIKPANILLENGVERVKITDFGLARAVDDVSITQSGMVAGTPQYMSPEQAQGQHVDHRSDLFSLGSVLYAMCTGRPPFRAESTIAVIRRVCDDTPRPIREINPEIPNRLAAIIDRLLEKDPDKRFQSAQEVANLLGKYLAHLQHPSAVKEPEFPHAISPAEKRPEERKGRIWPKVTAAVVVLSALVLGITEATGVTNFYGLVRDELFPGTGTLIVEVDDPAASVTVDGEEVVLTAAGLKELRLAQGFHDVLISRPGEKPHRELVDVVRDGKMAIVVTQEGIRTVAEEHYYPTLSPFEGVRWNGLNPEVKLNGSWHKLVSIDDVPATDIVRFAIEHHEKNWQKRFQEDLVQVMGEMGKRPGRSVNLAFADLDGSRERILANVEMTETNRRAIWQARKKRDAGGIAVHDESAKANYALSFDGVTSRVETPVRFDPAEPFTMEAWIKARRILGHQLIITNLDERGGATIETLGDNGLWKVAARFDGKFKHAHSQPILPNTLTHVAAVWQKGRWSLFVDGKWQSTIGGGEHLASQIPFSIGASSSRAPGEAPPDADTWEYHFDGIIDEVRFSKATRYVNNFVPEKRFKPDEEALALYHFDEGSGEVLKDASGNGRHGKIVEAKWVPSFADDDRQNQLAEVRRFEGSHLNPITSVAVSPNGRYLLSASYDKTVRLWEIESGREIRPFLGHASALLSAAFSPEGNQVITAGHGGTLRLWDVETGKLVRLFKGHTGWVRTVAFSPDGDFILSGSADYRPERDQRDHSLRLWDAATGEELFQFEGETQSINAAVFSPDGRFVLTASEVRRIALWDVETRRQVRRFAIPESTPISFAISPDGLIAATGHNANAPQDGEFFDPEHCVVCLWDVNTGQLIRKLSGHSGPVKAVDFSPDGRYVLSGSGGHHHGLTYSSTKDNTLRLWDAKTGEEVWKAETGTSINGVAFALDGRSVVSAGGELALGGGDNKPDLRIWRLPAELTSNATPESATKPVPEILIESASYDRHQFYVQDLAVSPDGKLAASVEMASPTVSVWEVDTRREVHEFKIDDENARTAAFSPDEKFLIIAGSHGECVLWNLESGDKFRSFEGHRGAILDMAFSPDGRQAATASGQWWKPEDDGKPDNTIRIWNVETGAQIRVIDAHEDQVTSVAFLPDGRSIFTGNRDPTARLWDTDSGEEIARLIPTGSEVFSVAVSPDGRFLAAGTGPSESGIQGREIDDPENFQVCLFDRETGKLVRRLKGHTGCINDLDFSPDGRLLISASGGQHVGKALPDGTAKTASPCLVFAGGFLAGRPQKALVFAGFWPAGAENVVTQFVLGFIK